MSWDISTARSNLTERVFAYEPLVKSTVDPMVYGAYRRAKLPPVSSSRDKNKKNKSGRKDADRNSFYDAIKNFGSGPVSKVRDSFSIKSFFSFANQLVTLLAVGVKQRSERRCPGSSPGEEAGVLQPSPEVLSITHSPSRPPILVTD